MQKIMVIGLAFWWVFGAWGVSTLGFPDPMLIVGLPFIIGFIVVTLLEGAISLRARLGRL